MTEISDLSTEIIIKIFEYLEVYDLCTLQQTCKRFYNIIKKATTLGNVYPILVTNQVQSVMRNRCTEFLNLLKKSKISHNWRYGIYREFVVSKEKKRYIPHLILQRDSVWFSKANQIHLYKRKKRSITHSSVINIPSNSDICKFAQQQGCFISGQRDGSIFISKSTFDHLHLENCHELDIDAIDLTDTVFVSGSKDMYLKLWPLKSELELPYMAIGSLRIGDRIWSTAINSKSSAVAVGTAGRNCNRDIKILDLNRFTVTSELGRRFCQDVGVLGLKWEGSHTLLSCGYDTYVRNWDMRIGRCVQKWKDPFHSTIYCFETDSCCTLLTGTQTNGRVVLWDMRTKSHFVQMYFMESCKNFFHSSPIYSLSFDVFQLFTATDCNLNVLDFSVKSGIAKNYGNCGMKYYC